MMADNRIREAVTIRHVAAKAGVSVGTVSRVLNNYANVNPERAAKVCQAIEALGYRRVSSAQLLASRRTGGRMRTGNIAIVFSELGHAWRGHPLLSQYTDGAESACAERGYNLMVELGDNLDELPRCIREQKVDGVLLKATNHIPVVLDEMARHLPVVGLSLYEPMSIERVGPDNRGAGWALTEFLWERGHRRIAFVSPDSGHRMFISRLHGYEEALQVRGAYDRRLVEHVARTGRALPEADYPDMRRPLEGLMALEPAERPTAIVAANDWCAAGLAVAAREMGLVLPKDLSLVGMDNLPYVCRAVGPKLTSYDPCLSQCSYVAVQALLDQIEHPDRELSPRLQLIPGRLVERDSVAPPAERRPVTVG